MRRNLRERKWKLESGRVEREKLEGERARKREKKGFQVRRPIYYKEEGLQV